nr:hypothetical protein BaRGS_004814 [Batillaria attramentaria]
MNRMKLSKSRPAGGGGAVDGNGVFYAGFENREMEGFEKTPASSLSPPAAEEDENAKKRRSIRDLFSP